MKGSRFLWVVFVVLGLSVIIGVFFFLKQSMVEKEPIKIGYLGVLTGVYSLEGVRAREGILLAVEKKNEAGGINGRPIELIVKDDENKSDVAARAVRELLDEGVDAILAHSSSTNTLHVIPLLKDSNVLMMGDAGSALISGMDDNYYRIDISTDQSGVGFAKLSWEILEAKKAAAIIDMDNPGFTEVLYNNYSDAYKALGGEIGNAITFHSSMQPDFRELVDGLEAVDVVLIAGSEAHMALIAQHLKRIQPDVDILLPYLTTDLLDIGGEALDGVYSITSIDENFVTQELQQWKEDFNKRFDDDFSHTVTVLVEAARILFEAMENQQKDEELKDTISRLGTFQGFQGPISFDPYGEVMRDQFIVQVVNDEKIILDKLEPSP